MNHLTKWIAISTLATVLAGCQVVADATKEPSDTILDKTLVEATTPCGRGARGIALVEVVGERFPDAKAPLMAKAETLAAAHMAGNDQLVQALRAIILAELIELYFPEVERAKVDWDSLSPLAKFNMVIQKMAQVGQNTAPISVAAAMADASCARSDVT